ncbi:tyrosine-protein phosphatase [Commensalibacter papalotli (ex Servin-Garciduenas et al. 2014)]|uniref:Protein tyrosine/serine phosphatase n=1 Tax=Commensalibacter papalotli (ex Servin-Garciduenas et al. 2014) TaxID=1208583 RepID=W7DU72_9PROT|nr:tyrosine-protein phosphatase [Commensalibacter papalotli (ex Servin-Garciduenas et al. 2014)]EUK18580.1 protein tyrosine/serine phosphatase [Commensalibacter papalotli (ex Servin-Garciduenas et al. 2014)]
MNVKFSFLSSSCIASLLFIIPLLCVTDIALAQTTQLNTPQLQGMDNFRDLAGIDTAYSTSHNGVMRPGVFYRSNAITPVGNDLSVMEKLNIGTVIDLRTDAEIATTPDTLSPNTSYYHVDIIGNQNSVVTLNYGSLNKDQINSMMQQTERNFVTDPYARSGFGNELKILANADSAALFHCTAGKDRTGWTAAVLQSLAGVDKQDIESNYLQTNKYTASRINATVAKLPTSMQESYRTIMSVDQSWLEAGLDQVAQTYGTMDNYLKQGLGLDQATIYVLRGKMVRYLTLPGQENFKGNAASGANLLNALQGTALSGAYTNYNYYLQSAIDQGSLNGLEMRVGGQVYADAASYLLRQPSKMNDMLMPLTTGREMKKGETAFWMQGLSNYLSTDARKGFNSSNEYTGGTVFGLTHRFNQKLSVNGGVGYNYGNVNSNGGRVTTNSGFVTLGGNYAFRGLDNSGAWIRAQANIGYVNYQSERQLGNGFGTTNGNTSGAYYSGRTMAGWLFKAQSFTIDPSVGIQVTSLHLGRVREKGSELALNMSKYDKIQPSLVANMDINFDPLHSGQWSFMPGVTLGYERILNNASVNQYGTIYGVGVRQYSAFNSPNIYKAGARLTAKRGQWSFNISADYYGAGLNSHGVNGMLGTTLNF